MARSLVNTIQSPIASPSLLAGGSFGGEGSVGAWVGYRDNFAAQAATLHIFSGLNGGIAVQDPATDLTATAQATGNTGNNIFFDFDDSGLGLSVTTSVAANGDRRIAISHDGTSTNSAVVSAIQGNGTANGWVSVSTANGGGTFYPQNGSTYDISVGGRNFYLKAGCDANTPRTSAGASTNTCSVGSYFSGTVPPQASGNGFITSSITQSNQGISIPFTMPAVSQLTPQSIRIKFKWYASRNLSGGASNGTIFKCYLIDADNTFQVYLGPLSDLSVGNQGSNSGFVNVVVPGGNVLGFGTVGLRSWSQNYRLAIHSVDTNFSLVISVDDVQIALDHGELQDLRDLRVFNPIINSGFDNWQRGTSFSTPASNTYTADRWVHEYDGTIGTFTISRQAFTLGQTNVPDEPQFYLQWNHTSAGSGSTFRRLSHRLEGVRHFAGKTVTLSFWAMSNAGFQSMSARLLQNFGGGGSASVTTASQSISLNNGQWFKHTLTFQVPSISGKTIGTSDYLGIVFDVPLNQTFQLNLAQVMISDGGASAQWRRAGNTVGHELALCQRFYEVSTRALMGVIENGAAQFHAWWWFKASKRISPVMTGSSVTFTVRNQASGQSFGGSFNGTLSNTGSADNTELFQTDGATTGGFTNGNSCYQDGGTITADAEIY